MAKGRGSAMVAAAVLCLAVAALHFQEAQAATYVVGGRAAGWTFNLSGWPRGKHFKAGDVLVFKYKKGTHNVVAVNKAGYDGCSTSPRNAKVYTSGNDQITLVKGLNNFICTYPGHCSAGMKIQVNAS